MLRFISLLTMIQIGLAGTASYGLSEPFPPSPQGSVFAEEAVLNVELDAPLDDLFTKNDANTTDEKVFVQGQLSYFTQNQKITVPVRVRVKGHSTVTFCPFKKLELKFIENKTAATIFAGMKSIDLNTHCAEINELDVYEQHFNSSFHNHREVVIYKMAKTLRVPTFQARAVFIKYINTGLNVDSAKLPYQAFFLEDTGDFLKRLNAREVKATDFSRAGQLDASTQPEFANDDLFRATLFNDLIRNSDWGFPCGDFDNRFWNLKVIETQKGKWVPLVYDFNLSPIVTNEHSYPTTKECNLKVSGEQKLAIIKSFKEKRAELYTLLETLKNDKPAYDHLKIILDYFFEKY